MFGPAGEVHRAVLARVELIVVVVRERGERAGGDGGDEELERLAQARRLRRELEGVLLRLPAAGDERLDRPAHAIVADAEALRRGHRVEGELKAHAAVDLRVEVLVAQRLSRLVVDDTVAHGRVRGAT